MVITVSWHQSHLFKHHPSLSGWKLSLIDDNETLHPKWYIPWAKPHFFHVNVKKAPSFFWNLPRLPLRSSLWSLKKTSLIMFCHYWVTSIAHHFLPFLLYTTPPLHHHGKGMKPANMVPEAIEMMARVKLRMGPVSENAPTAAEKIPLPGLSWPGSDPWDPLRSKWWFYGISIGIE